MLRMGGGRQDGLVPVYVFVCMYVFVGESINKVGPRWMRREKTIHKSQNALLAKPNVSHFMGKLPINLILRWG